MSEYTAIAVLVIGGIYILKDLITSLNQKNPMVVPFQYLGIAAVFSALIAAFGLSRHIAGTLGVAGITNTTGGLYYAGLVLFSVACFFIIMGGTWWALKWLVEAVKNRKTKKNKRGLRSPY